MYTKLIVGCAVAALTIVSFATIDWPKMDRLEGSSFLGIGGEETGQTPSSLSSSQRSSSDAFETARITPTSYFKSEKYSGAVAILSTIDDFFPINCKTIVVRDTLTQNLKAACQHQGSLVCRQRGEFLNISTGFKVKVGHSSADAECRVYFPPHAATASGTVVSESLEDCAFSKEDSEGALYLEESVPSCDDQNLGRIGEEGCIAPGKLSDAIRSKGYATYSGWEDDRFTSRNDLPYRSDISYIQANPQLCKDNQVVSFGEFDGLRQIKTIEELASYCDGGVAVCGSFTGAASGSKRCAHSSSSELIDDYMYHLDGAAHTFRANSVASYFTNAPGLSGSGHYCFRGDEVIPFGMTVGMRRFGRVSSLSESARDSGLTFEDIQRDNFFRGDRSDDPRSEEADTLDFNIVSTIFQTVD